MRYPKLRELKEVIRALIKSPYTSKYPAVPAKVYERFRGRPYFYEEDCTGCTACAQVCPPRAIDFEDKVKNNKGKRKLTINWDICIFCGQCEASCLTGKGIILSREFEFATCGRREELKQEIEKELILCECCSEVVAPIDQYEWVAKRLGALCFTNSSLMLFYLRTLGLGLNEKLAPKGEENFIRTDRIKVLCPRCRRQAVIKS
jgi:hydrogenase-4 component H